MSMQLKQACNELGWEYQEKMQEEQELPDERVATHTCRELSELFYHYVNLEIPDNQAEAAATQRLVATLEDMAKRLSEGRPITQLALAELKEKLTV